MKNILKYAFLLVLFICFMINVKADLKDYSGGKTGSLGNMSGGEWSTYSVGLKISIVNSSNVVEDSQIFLNKNGENFSVNGMFAASSNKPKTHQSPKIKWVDGSEVDTYNVSFLPTQWTTGSTMVNLYNILENNNYKNLKSLIEHNSLKSSLSPGDYILVEPMTKVKGYYGTAYELANAFIKESECSTKKTFCYVYTKDIFSGNKNQKNGGIFYNTIYLSSNISALGLKKHTDSGSDIYKSRRSCFKSKTCGRGIGVFEYNDIYPSDLTIIYHSNGATTKTYQGKAFTDDSNIPKQVVAKGKKVDNGLYNIQNKDYLYLSKTEADSTGKWLLGSEISATKLDQNTPITWDGAKAKIGDTIIADLSTGSKTIHVYADWLFNQLTVIYHGNGGYTSEGQAIVQDEIKFGDYYTIRGVDLFTRNDHSFVGWTTNEDGTGYNWTNWKGIWNLNNGYNGIENNELHLYAKWQDSCHFEFNRDSTPANRLEMYKNYSIHSANTSSRRNLLNFTIPDAETACGNYTPDYQPNNACLMTDQINDLTENKFTYENLSDYNDVITSSSTQDISYCLTDFELTKGANVNYNSNQRVKAGTMVFNINETDAVAIGELTKTCYIHKNVYNNYIGDITRENFINPDDYISTLTLDGVELDKAFIKQDPVSTLEGDFYKVVGKVNIEYKPTKVCVERLTGKYPVDCSNTSQVRTLGYGVLSKFNDDPSSTQSFNFRISVGGKFSFDSETACQYNVEREIIKYPDSSPKGKLDLEFRIIDIKKPFNRNTKINWCDGNDCSKDNDVVKKYIINSINSYGLDKDGNKKEPIYKIILDADSINTIRKYNEKNQYTYYKLINNKDNDLVNAFVYDLKNGVLNQYKEDNTVDYSFGTLKYRLEY